MDNKKNMSQNNKHNTSTQVKCHKLTNLIALVHKIHKSLTKINIYNFKNKQVLSCVNGWGVVYVKWSNENINWILKFDLSFTLHNYILLKEKVKETRPNN